MATTPMTASDLRALLLQVWRAKYLLRSRALDTSLDSDAYIQADAFSVLVEGLESRLDEQAKEIFPDTASHDGLLKHAEMIGLSQKQATQARFDVTQIGTAGSAFSTTDTLKAPDGSKFHPVVNGTLASSGSTIEVQAELAGAAGNKAVGAILTWDTAPTGLAGTATVALSTFEGTDAESDPDLAARVLEWWAERPGGGNRSDYVQWAESRDGIDRAYVYPRLHPTLGGNVPGTVTVLILTAPPNRIAPGGNITDVYDYLIGSGVYATGDGQVPLTVSSSDVTVVTATPQNQSVIVQVTLGPGYAFPWSSTVTTTTGSTTTVLNLSATPPAGMTVGSYLALRITDGSERGGYAVRKVTAVDTVGNTVTLDTAVATTPGTGVSILPAPANWAAIRDAVLAVFDVLGPGDSTIAGSGRWPAVSASDGATLYQSAVIAAVQGVPGLPAAPSGVGGVVGCTVTLSGATDPTKVTPPPLTLLVPDEIRITA